MRIFLLISLFIYIFSFNLRQTKISYDSYVFALQWPNGFCKINNCGTRANHIYKNTLTIHGLWPNLKNGAQLKECTSGVSIKDNGSQLFKELGQYWPSLTGENNVFWEHEYNKHGYCMVEENNWDGYEDYFEFALQLYHKKYKNLITNAFPGETSRVKNVSYEEMKKKIQSVIPKAAFKMNCRNKFIYEFYFYLEKNYNPSSNFKITNSCPSGILVFG